MSTSSDEDDEIDAAKLAALRSVAIDSSAVVQNASAPVASLRKSGKPGASGSANTRGAEEDEAKNSSGLKLYQTRVNVSTFSLSLLWKCSLEVATGESVVAVAKIIHVTGMSIQQRERP
jgi:hypothetical protein